MMSNPTNSGSSLTGSVIPLPISNGSGHSHHPTSSSSSNSNRRQVKGQGQRADFASVLRKWSAPIPPTLSRKLGRGSDSPLGKVKVMLRVSDTEEVGGIQGILGVDQRRKQVTLVDPGGSGPNGITPEERRVGVSAPKMFAFDGIFGQDDDQGEICAASAAELVASVIGGEDGCLVSLGHCTTGKNQTMFGKPSNQKLGAVPTAISWLFKSIQEQKQKTGSRFSVRVSAVEVTGGSVHETVTDLLLPFVNDGDQPPGSYLLDGKGSKGQSPIILSTVSEVRAPNPETAAFYLDSALDSLASRKEDLISNSNTNTTGPIQNSINSGHSGGHFLFTLHVYQYSIDKNGKGVVGGRSRLHCILLGNGSPSISVLSGLLLAVLNGQRHLPSSNHSKLGSILRECLGSLTCRAVVMIHISNSHSRYAETLAALQLGSRVHRLRRSRRLKMGSVGSGTGSGGSSGGSGEEMRQVLSTNPPLLELEGSSSTDIDPSSSEQSCDTVIYLGPSIDEATDGEHPPLYLPSLDSNSTPNPSTKLPNKCSLNQVPKTKSPKPKSSSPNPNFPLNSNSKEEKWIDGPKVSNPKYLNKLSSSQAPSSRKRDPGETWIDGPAARVKSTYQNQASNFPSPKKTLNPRIKNDPCIMTSTKAQMIQKWISNHSSTHSPTFFEFDDISQFDDSIFSSNGSILTENGSLSLSNSNLAPYFLQDTTKFLQKFPEQEYKSLTVFKTCEDEDFDVNLKLKPPTEDSGYEFEFIEVTEPEIPAQTKDVCLQVTEEDLLLSFLDLKEENPLPESDQNFIMASTQTNKKLEDFDLDTDKYEKFDRARSASFSAFSDCTLETGQSDRFDRLDEDNHPLRVLSQECLTVVSTFTDSLSVNGDDRFWPNFDLNDLQYLANPEGTNTKICHGLCKNLVTLSQMSLDNLNDFPVTNPTKSDQVQPILTNKPPTGQKLEKTQAKDPSQSLGPETIFKFKVPPIPKPRLSSLSSRSRKSISSGGVSGASDAEQETLIIHPMELLDVNQIKNNCHPIDKDVANPSPNHQINKKVVHLGCDHNHHHHNYSNSNGNSNGNSVIVNGSTGSTLSIHSGSGTGTLTPPESPPIPTSNIAQSPETNGKSPKSKSRKISKFFRSRSKSPKKVLAEGGNATKSSSESGKSSDAKHSSSSSSCSSGVSLPGSKVNSKNAKMSPKHQQQLKVHVHPAPAFNMEQNTNGTVSDYHFKCDSAFPMFLPCPGPNSKSKVLTSIENGNTKK